MVIVKILGKMKLVATPKTRETKFANGDMFFLYTKDMTIKLEKRK